MDLPIPERARDQHRAGIRFEVDVLAIGIFSHQDGVAFGLENAGVVAANHVDKLDHPGAVIARKPDIGCLLDHGQSVGHRRGATAGMQECVIVLCVAHSDHIVRRELELRERGIQSRRLVHARRQYHHRALVENDLQFQTELTDHFEDRGLVRLPGRDDRVPDRQRRNIALLELFHENSRRSRRDHVLLARRRLIEQRAVFRHNEVENADFRKGPLQARQFPSRHKNKPPPGLLETLQGAAGVGMDDAVMRDGAVKIGGESQEVQANLRDQ